MAIEPRRKSAVNVEDVAALSGALASRRSLSDDVYERLVEFLMVEDLEPGTPIKIDALARAWQVSQTPIREAMVRAEEAGLVVRIPLRGFMVAPLLTADEFGQLMEMRLLIEPHCAAKACKHANDELISVLERHTRTMRDAPKGPSSRDYQEYMRADRAFHDAIAAASGNTFLRSALSMSAMHAHRFRRFSGGFVDDSAETLVEHSAVLEALRNRDVEGARSAMRQHLLGVEKRARLTTDAGQASSGTKKRSRRA